MLALYSHTQDWNETLIFKVESSVANLAFGSPANTFQTEVGCQKFSELTHLYRRLSFAISHEMPKKATTSEASAFSNNDLWVLADERCLRHILRAGGIIHFRLGVVVNAADLCNVDFVFVKSCEYLLTYFACACLSLQALEKAKEAGRKERMLVRQREQSGNADHINLDLTYSVSKAAVYQWLYQRLHRKWNYTLKGHA